MKLTRSVLVLLLAVLPMLANAAVWIGNQLPDMEKAHNENPAEKAFYVLEGDYPHGQLHDKPDAMETQAYLLDPNGTVQPVKVAQGLIQFKTPLKGYHWVFYLERKLHNGTLETTLTKHYFYNKDGDISDSILKEVRGKTTGSKYGKPPIAEVPFELVLQKPLHDHHIDCCLYTGDTLPLKVFHQQQAVPDASVQALTDKGWNMAMQTGNDGETRFIVPRDTYADTSKHGGMGLLVTAEYTDSTAGNFQNQAYQHQLFRMAQTVSYSASPLDWAAKLPAFLLVFASLFAFGFGVFLYRKRGRR